MSNTDKPHIPSYGQHFNCAERMLGKSRYRVFSRLIDEYSIGLIDSDSDKYFTMSDSMISYRVGGMDRQLVNSTLKWLQQRNLINVSHGNIIKVNAPYYIALVSAFDKLTKKEEKQFASDLDAGIDMRQEYNLPVISDIDADNMLRMMKGCRKTDNTDGKPTILTESRQGCSISVNSEGKPTTLTEIRQYCRESVKNQYDLHDVLSSVVTESRQFSRETVNDLRNWMDKMGIGVDIDGNPSLISHLIAFKCLADMTENLQESDGNPSVGCRFSVTVNIKYKKDCLRPSEARTHNIGEEEKSSEDKEEVEEEKAERSDKVEIPELVDKNFIESYSSRPFRDPYCKKPFLSRAKLREVTASYQEGQVVKSPAEFFINVFYWAIYDLYYDFYIDPENEEQVENMSDDDMNGISLPQDVISSVVKSIMDDIVAAIADKQGQFDYRIDNEIVNIQLDFGEKELEDLQPEHLYDWKEVRMKDGQKGVLVDLEKFRDINAEVKPIKTPKTRPELIEERKLSRSLMGLILESNEKDLTPIEIAISRFVKEFGQLDEFGLLKCFSTSREFTIPAERNLKSEKAVSVAVSKTINRTLYLPALMRIKDEFGIWPEDFLGIMTPEFVLHNKEIQAAANLFSYVKVMTYNTMKGWESKLFDENKLRASKYYNPLESL